MSTFIFYVILGCAVIALGIYAIRNPYSWFFRRISDDNEPSELRIWYLRFAGKITIGFGALIIVLGAQSLFV